jgi:hypothetical protein
MAQYKKGSVSIQHNSYTVSGNDTTWTSVIAATNNIFMVKGESNIYEIASYISPNCITLQQPYLNTNSTGIKYKDYLIVQNYTSNTHSPLIKNKDWNWTTLVTATLRNLDKELYKLGVTNTTTACNYLNLEAAPSGTFTSTLGGSYYTPHYSIKPVKGKVFYDSYYDKLLMYVGVTASAAPPSGGDASAASYWYPQWNIIGSS